MFCVLREIKQTKQQQKSHVAQGCSLTISSSQNFLGLLPQSPSMLPYCFCIQKEHTSGESRQRPQREEKKECRFGNTSSF